MFYLRNFEKKILWKNYKSLLKEPFKTELLKIYIKFVNYDNYFRIVEYLKHFFNKKFQHTTVSLLLSVYFAELNS